MIQISLRNNFPDVKRKLQGLADDVANKVLGRAMNKSIDQGRTRMVKEISAEFRVTQSAVKQRLSVQHVMTRKGNVRMTVRLEARRAGGLHGNDERGMNLINFVIGGQPKRSKRGSMRQLSFQIKRTGGRKQIPGAFITTNKKTNGTAVFIREGKSRYPIKTITTIDVAQMFNTRRINKAVVSSILDNFEKNFQRELRVILGGWAK